MAKDVAPSVATEAERKSSVTVYLRGSTPPKVDFGEEATITAKGKIKRIGEDYDGKGYNIEIEPAAITVSSATNADKMTQAAYEAWRKSKKD